MQIRQANEKDLERIHQIQQAAYRVEAELLKAPFFPPLHETIEDLKTSGDETYVAVIDSNPVGAIALEKMTDSVLISKLVVDPLFFRRGIAKKLVQFSLNLYSGTRFAVETGAENGPALKLYESLGFRPGEERTVEGGLRLVQLFTLQNT